MGSLVCALASYLDAKHQHGTWLVRIEDIDPPREQAGATGLILDTLQKHGLVWDGDVRFQSQRSRAYDQALQTLATKQLTYRCDCTRKRLKDILGGYDNHCRNRQLTGEQPSAIRLNIDDASQYASPVIDIQDHIQAIHQENVANPGDFVVHRKDGLYAYQLAVVVDDIDQNITHIVRGADLFDCTGTQRFLTTLLNGNRISYSHIPVLCDDEGKKLSKQNHAPAINNHRAKNNIIEAFTLLQLNPPAQLSEMSLDQLLLWGAEHWSIQQLKNTQCTTYSP